MTETSASGSASTVPASTTPLPASTSPAVPASSPEVTPATTPLPRSPTPAAGVHHDENEAEEEVREIRPNDKMLCLYPETIRSVCILQKHFSGVCVPPFFHFFLFVFMCADPVVVLKSRKAADGNGTEWYIHWTECLFFQPLFLFTSVMPTSFAFFPSPSENSQQKVG